ncbi:hypothetical protein T05_1121 [Trichinella murrelli]|uniref:Uncharacterized protein n=1 Tax=Trichinella murrelli TaxID=144512 RepID=A0A0V0T3D9_9BILA|nr:hypothetical protein T05_1121 [Trichinella murrelli]
MSSINLIAASKPGCTTASMFSAEEIEDLSNFSLKIREP